MTTSGGRVLITPRSLDGVAVRGRDGRRIGEISTVVIDEADGRIAYALLGQRTVLGVGDKFRPVPWDALRYDPVTGDYNASFDRGSFEGAPAYDSDQLGSKAYGWVEQVERYFAGSRVKGSAIAASEPRPH